MDKEHEIGMAGFKRHGKQKQLGYGWLVVLVSCSNMFVCMSLDIYLPAIPAMAGYLNTTAELVNLTMTLFYAFLAVGTLVFGPISEKYGRRTPFIVGVTIYLVASVGCALASSIGVLIICRMGQAFGGGGMVAISTALVKDCFERNHQGQVLAMANSISMIGPMAAPLVSAVMISFLGWRSVFALLAIMGSLCLALAIRLVEPLPPEKRYAGTIAHSLARLFVVARKPRFSWLLLVTSFMLAPFMGYVSVSSYLYMDLYGLNETSYGFMYAINTLFTIATPFLYAKMEARFRPRSFVRMIACATLMSGVLLLVVGTRGAAFFLVSVIPMTMAECTLRPCIVPVLLDQQENDTGSAASLINFAYTFIGAGGMLIGMMGEGIYLYALAALCIALSLLPMGILSILQHTKLNIVELN